MHRLALALALALAAPLPAVAHLADGVAAPVFAAKAAQGGTVSDFDLHAALANGPVVLYFFPKSFTSGCTAEAHDFAEHIAAFKKLGATVVGVSGDDIATQVKFSTLECRSQFLVASDPGLRIAKSYDAVVMNVFASRTSYVIARNGTIAYAYTSLDPDQHVANVLAALKKLSTSTISERALRR
jgi:peroxiredoxin Q/BCP